MQPRSYETTQRCGLWYWRRAAKAFVRGDLRWMQDQMAATKEGRRVGARKLAMALNALNTLSKPLIARVQGNAFGSGIGMMSVADVAVGVSMAKFGLT